MRQSISGTSASAVQADAAAKATLIRTTKECLVSKISSTSVGLNVTIASITDTARRRSLTDSITDEHSHVLAESRHLEQFHLLAGVSILFKISFDVDALQFTDASSGYSTMVSTFSSSAASGTFTTLMQTYAGEMSNC